MLLLAWPHGEPLLRLDQGLKRELNRSIKELKEYVLMNFLLRKVFPRAEFVNNGGLEDHSDWPHRLDRGCGRSNRGTRRI